MPDPAGYVELLEQPAAVTAKAAVSSSAPALDEMRMSVLLYVVAR